MPLGWLESVEPRGNHRVQAFRHLERVERAGGAVCPTLLDDESSVKEHAHRLHCIERDSCGALEDAFPKFFGHAWDHAAQQRGHRLARQRFEVEGREAALADAPARTALGDLRPRQREHQDRAVSRPLEEVLDEVEQAAVRPLQFLENKHRELVSSDALEEHPPRGKQVARLARYLTVDPQKLRESGFHPSGAPRRR